MISFLGLGSNMDNRLSHLNSAIDTISKEKPTGIKGNFIISAYLTSTMGISYKFKAKAI